MYKQAIEQFGVEFSEPGWQRLSSDSECRELLEEAGYENIEIAIRQMGYHLSSEQDWREQVTNGGFRGFLEQLEPARQAEFRVQHPGQVQTLCTGNGLWLNVETLFTRGNNLR